LEIICLCGHADCGVTALQSSAKRESDSRSEVKSSGSPAARS
jgi:carbonic anhydrase